MMTSDFEQTDTGVCKPIKVLSSSSCRAAVEDEAEIAIKLIVTSSETGQLRSLLKSNQSLVENAHDWVRSVSRITDANDIDDCSSGYQIATKDAAERFYGKRLVIFFDQMMSTLISTLFL